MGASEGAGRFSTWTALLACCLPGLAFAGLNDTGIIKFGDPTSYELAAEPASHPGQDARYGRDAAALSGKLRKEGSGAKGFDFTKLDDNGKPLPVEAKSWVCVRDNLTGLVWEVKTADGGLRDGNHLYTWYNPDSKVNGGFAGVENGGECGGGTACDTFSYTRAVNAGRLCGFTDWRMPARAELRSIVDYSKAAPDGPPAIDENYFANMPVNPPI